MRKTGMGGVSTVVLVSTMAVKVTRIVEITMV